jgi:hypothetical protein
MEASVELPVQGQETEELKRDPKIGRAEALRRSIAVHDRHWKGLRSATCLLGGIVLVGESGAARNACPLLAASPDKLRRCAEDRSWVTSGPALLPRDVRLFQLRTINEFWSGQRRANFGHRMAGWPVLRGRANLASGAPSR